MRAIMPEGFFIQRRFLVIVDFAMWCGQPAIFDTRCQDCDFSELIKLEGNTSAAKSRHVPCLRNCKVPANQWRGAEGGDAMRFYVLKSMTVKAATFAVSGIRTTGPDALLGAACGALYGMVFGGFGALVRDDVSRILLIAGICALAGFAVGAAAGAMRGLFEKSKTKSAADSSGSFGQAEAPNTRRPIYAGPVIGADQQNHLPAIAAKSRPRVTAIAG